MSEKQDNDDFARAVRERFQSDYRTILQAHFDDLDGMFQFHEDGTTELLNGYRELSEQNQILIRLIAERFKAEANISDDDSIPYAEIYPLFPDKSESTVRGYFMRLRKDGFAKRTDEGHVFVVERLPDAIERIEEAVNSG